MLAFYITLIQVAGHLMPHVCSLLPTRAITPALDCLSTSKLSFKHGQCVTTFPLRYKGWYCAIAVGLDVAMSELPDEI